MLYRFLQWALRPFFRWRFRLRTDGLEHVPATGPVLVVCNHVTALDPFMLGTVIGPRLHTMAKIELMRVPVAGWFLRQIGTFPVRRGEPDRQAIRTAMEILQQGKFLLMFLEGTRSSTGRLQPAEPGAALLALRSGAPVLPVAIAGAQRMMPRGTWWPRHADITIHMGPLLDVPKREGRIDRAELEAWGQRFLAAIGALLPPDQQPLPDQGAASSPVEPVREVLPPNAGP